MVLCDDFAMVGDRDPYITCSVGGNIDSDIGSLEPVFEGVLDQVVEHLVDLVGETIHDRTVRLAGPVVNQNDTHLAARGTRLEAGNNGLHDLEQRHPFVRNDMLVDLDPRQGQQIVDQP